MNIAIWILSHFAILLLFGLVSTSDESCEPQCDAAELCLDGECVPLGWSSLPEMPDEDDSPNARPRRKKRATEGQCSVDQFQCPESVPDDVKCAMECDGNPECDGGEDELNCVQGCRCAVPPGQRVNCDDSYIGPYTEKICRENLTGCCWDDSKRGRPFCYKENTDDIATKSRMCQPVLPPIYRKNNGWEGCTPNQCFCQGGCFDKRNKQVYCYKPKICQMYSVEGVASAQQKEFVNGVYGIETSTCIGPFGGNLPVYRNANNSLVLLYYVQENGEWLFGGGNCSPFTGVRLITKEIVPDAVTTGWEEYDSSDWVGNANITISCLEYPED